jgi:hypothetical protein
VITAVCMCIHTSTDLTVLIICGLLFGDLGHKTDPARWLFHERLFARDSSDYKNGIYVASFVVPASRHEHDIWDELETPGSDHVCMYRKRASLQKMVKESKWWNSAPHFERYSSDVLVCVHNNKC